MNVSNESEQASAIASIISPEVHQLCIEVLHVPLFIFGVFGIFSNTINLLVFYKQGVTADSTTASLFALSVSDLLGCAFMLPQPFCFYLMDLFGAGGDPSGRNCYALTTMACTYSHIICSKITCVITAYVSVERAVSVVFPLRARNIIRTRNTVVIIVTIYVAVTACHLPYASSIRVAWNAWGALNVTVVSLSVTSLGELFHVINNVAIAIVLTTVSMATVAVATFVMISRVHASLKWRQALKTEKNADSTSTVVLQTRSQTHGAMSARNVEMCKTVTGITTLFLVCSACSHAPALAAFALPGMSTYGANKNLYAIIYTLKFDFDLINSSATMLFYLKMSSRYRHTVARLIKTVRFPHFMLQ